MGKDQIYSFAKDYLRYCLTGSMETDHIDAAGSMFYDAGKEQWSKELCEIGHIQEEWLPRVCNPTDVAGEVSKEAAEKYGLKAGTKVLVGTTDTVMEVFASGNVKRPCHCKTCYSRTYLRCYR